MCRAGALAWGVYCSDRRACGCLARCFSDVIVPTVAFCVTSPDQARSSDITRCDNVPLAHERGHVASIDDGIAGMMRVRDAWRMVFWASDALRGYATRSRGLQGVGMRFQDSRSAGMEIAIQEIDQSNRQYVGCCDGVFTVDSELVLAAEDGVLRFTVVERPAYEKRYPEEFIDVDSYVNSSERVIFFAFVDGVIGGQIRLCHYWNAYAYVEDFVVDVRFRRRGVGRALMQEAVRWAQARRLAGVMLETQQDNVAACLFYQRFGFELSGFDRRLYQGLKPGTSEVALYWYLVF